MRAMHPTNGPALFFALTRRLERLQAERRMAWMMGDDDQHDKLARRCHTLISSIFNLELP